MTEQKAIKYLDIASNAIEKQIPKKPRFYIHNYYCSICGHLVGNNEFKWQNENYCDNCGNAIDWSKEE